MAKRLLFNAALFLLIIGYLKETECVSLQILSQTEEKYSECISGLLDGKDRYIFSSKIDTTTFDILQRRSIIFQMKRSASDIFDPICRLNILSSACPDSPQDGCYCKSNTSFVLDVILNNTANAQYSNSIVRFYLPDPNTGVGDYSNNYTVPVIQSVFTESLTFNGSYLDPESCIFKQQSSLTLDWCVTGLSSHKLSIFSGQEILSEGENCVNYTFNSSSSLNSLNVSFHELNNCQRSRTHVCLLKAKAADDDGDDTVAIAVGVTASAVVLAGVAGAIVYVVKKKHGDSPNNPDTNSTTSTGHNMASNRAPIPPKPLPSNSVIYPETELEKNTEANVASLNEEEKSKKIKKKRSKRVKKLQNDNTENDRTSSAFNVEVLFKESEDNFGKSKQSNLEVISFKKRLPSVEITNNSIPITPRPLPQIKAATEQKRSK